MARRTVTVTSNTKPKGNRVKDTFKDLFLGKTDEQKFKQVLNTYREQYLPEEYNQLTMLDELCNDSIDHYISITTRGDGKSFNYISALGYIAYHLDMPVMLIVRHWSLQSAMKDLVMTILNTIKWCNYEELTWESNTDYMACYLGVKRLFLVTDINRASDLKQHSAVLKEYGIILYDEFLTLTDDYVDEEYTKLATIYKSVDRVKDRKYIKHPKVIYLGNPVNFNSPLLPALKIYDHLQNHPINTMKQYNNVLLEMRRNEHRNDGKNLRAFPDPNDSDVTGEFKFDTYKLTTPEEYVSNMNNGEYVEVRLDSLMCFKILKNGKNYILSVEKTDNNEQYTLSLNDCNTFRKYLDNKFFKDSMSKRYEKGLFLFKDAFSKEYITERHPELMRLNIYRLFSKSVEIDKEEVYNETTKRTFLQKLYERFML